MITAINMFNFVITFAVTMEATMEATNKLPADLDIEASVEPDNQEKGLLSRMLSAIYSFVTHHDEEEFM